MKLRRSRSRTTPSRKPQPDMVRETPLEWAANPKPPARQTVGVRELRQNLSIYLDRVKTGVTLSVTEHGHVVAVLRPASEKLTGLARLIAEGRVTPATRSFATHPPTPRPAPPGTPPMSQILDELREDRF